MIVKSYGAYGDRVTMTSSLGSPGCIRASNLTFRLYVQREDDKIGGRLEVVALSEQRVPLWTLYRSGGDFNKWKRYSVPMPNESVHIAFTAVIGQPFVSDVILDDVGVACWDTETFDKRMTTLMLCVSF